MKLQSSVKAELKTGRQVKEPHSIPDGQSGVLTAYYSGIFRTSAECDRAHRGNRLLQIGGLEGNHQAANAPHS